MKAKLSFNESGQVVEPKLHDGKVVGIVLRDGDVQLQVVDATGHRHSLLLRAVERLRGSDFREGNIILDVVVRSCGADDEEVLRYLFDLGTTGQDSSFLTDLRKRLSKEKRVLVEVIPSYGCALVALCERIEIARSES